MAKGDALPAFDYQIASMSLALAFGTTVENAPGRVPYLKPDPARAVAWKTRLGPDGFKIGICWRGGRPGNDMGRGFPLVLLQAISRLPGVRLISLQKGEGEAQLATLPPGMMVETLGADFDYGPNAFLDTIAVMENLDLVITCDTAIAHLAGALARPFWMATKQVPEWRWLLNRSDSVWYPHRPRPPAGAEETGQNVFAAMDGNQDTAGEALDVILSAAAAMPHLIVTGPHIAATGRIGSLSKMTKEICNLRPCPTFRRD